MPLTSSPQLINALFLDIKFKDHGLESEKSNDSLVAMTLPQGAIELNENVFLELRVIEEQPEPEHESTRRPIFA